jgi:hypothetical protein
MAVTATKPLQNTAAWMLGIRHILRTHQPRHDLAGYRGGRKPNAKASAQTHEGSGTRGPGNTNTPTLHSGSGPISSSVSHRRVVLAGLVQFP